MSLRAVGLGFLVWIALLPLAAGCAPYAVPLKLPSQGGPPWIELQTDHFTMWTDATSEQAHEVLKELEERRQILARGMNRA